MYKHAGGHWSAPLCSVKANRDLLKGLVLFRLPIECVTRAISKSSDWSARGEVGSSFALPGDIRDQSPPVVAQRGEIKQLERTTVILYLIK